MLRLRLYDSEAPQVGGLGKWGSEALTWLETKTEQTQPQAFHRTFTSGKPGVSVERQIRRDLASFILLMSHFNIFFYNELPRQLSSS